MVNAVGMLCATGAAVGLTATWPLLLAGGGLLTALVWVGRGHWTSTGAFGPANATTAARAGLLAGMPAAAAVGPGPFLALGTAFLLADGLDGWIARRYGHVSAFGAFFDKEADALFVLLLCALATFEGRLPPWILGAGLLRYGFVVLLFLVPRREKTERQFSFARYAYGGMVGALLLSFLPYPGLYEPLVVVATGALVASFGWSTRELLVRPRAAEA